MSRTSLWDARRLCAAGAMILAGVLASGCSSDTENKLWKESSQAALSAMEANDGVLSYPGRDWRPGQYGRLWPWPRHREKWAKWDYGDDGCIAIPDGEEIFETTMDGPIGLRDYDMIEALLFTRYACLFEHGWEGTLQRIDCNPHYDEPLNMAVLGKSAGVYEPRKSWVQIYQVLILNCLSDASRAVFDELDAPFPTNDPWSPAVETWTELCGGGQRASSYTRYTVGLFGRGVAASSSASSTDGVLVNVLVNAGHEWAEAVDYFVAAYREHGIPCGLEQAG